MGLGGTYFVVFEQLPADGEVPAGAQGFAAGAQVAEQSGALHTPVQGRHVQGAQVVFKQLVSV